MRVEKRDTRSDSRERESKEGARVEKERVEKECE